jgi:PAS domain S-box-containing protein
LLRDDATPEIDVPRIVALLEAQRREFGEREARFRALTELSADCYWESDAAHRLSHVASRRSLEPGLLGSGAAGRSLWELVGRPDTPDWHAHLANLEARRVFRNFVFPREERGRRTWIALSGEPRYDAGGAFVGYRGVGRDVTTEREALESLRESEARYRSLVELSPDAVLIFQDERVAFANRSAADLLRAPEPAALVGRSLWRIVARQFHDAVREGLNRLAAGGVLARVEQSCVRLDGGVAEVEISAAAFTHLGRGAVLMLARDIAERKRAEKRIHELNAGLEREVEERTRELRASIAELESFSYTVSHDLRAPLRAIDGLSRILLADHGASLAPEAQRLLERVSGNARVMGQLIDGLLDFSRLSRKALAAEPVDMRALALAAVEDARGVSAPGTEFRVGELPQAWGDPLLLRQVWANLVGNAAKFSTNVSLPRVEVRGRAEAGELRYCVRDNGVGFNTAHAGKLFGVFQRLHDPGQFEGTGVGLAITRRIVERHGGRVWAESDPGAGATFHFSLPFSLPCP